MVDYVDILTKEFDRINAKFRIVSANHVKELFEEIDNLKDASQISVKLYDLCMSNFNKIKNLKDNHTIIIVGIPQKITILEFRHNGKKYDVVIPPSYIYEGSRKICIDILSKVFYGKINAVDVAYIPLKLLAVRSGLGKYGKNNICYIEGIGSFLRLEAYYLDCQVGVDNWQEKQRLEECKDCKICMKSCPHNCIDDNRFLINAEHCLTYFNEDDEEFPEWVTAHNSLVGCMKCQINCPMNKDVIKIKNRGIVFSEDETEIILRGFREEDYQQHVYEKIRKLNMDEYSSLLPRNLRVLLQ
jgi:epoxyqueuosine reductase